MRLFSSAFIQYVCAAVNVFAALELDGTASAMHAAVAVLWFGCALISTIMAGEKK